VRVAQERYRRDITLLVTGLSANARYAVTVQPGGGRDLIGIAIGPGTTSDAAGLLQVAF
jgi:hypothetical protein